MTSSGVLNIVTSPWLVGRMGPLRTWAPDTMANLLDAPLLTRLRELWPTLPSAQYDAVVKVRMLLHLLTLKTPYSAAVLAEARALMATALADGGREGNAGGQAVTLAAALVMDRNPAFKPDAEAAGLAGCAAPLVGTLVAGAASSLAALVSHAGRETRTAVLAALAPSLAPKDWRGTSGQSPLWQPPHPRYLTAGELGASARLLEVHPGLLQRYAHAPPGGPTAAMCLAPGVAARADEVGAEAPAPGKVSVGVVQYGRGTSSHFALPAGPYKEAAERAAFLSRGVGALNRVGMLAGVEGADIREHEGVTEAALASATAYLRAGTGTATRVRAAAAAIASTGMLTSSRSALGGGEAAALGASSMGWRGKRGRDVVVVSEEDVERMKASKRAATVAGGSSSGGPSLQATRAPSSTSLSGMGASSQGSSAAVAARAEGGAPKSLDEHLTDASFLSDAARAVVTAFRDRGVAGQPRASGAPAAGGAGAGAPPLGSTLPPGAPQSVHVYHLRDEAGPGGATLRVFLQLDFSADGGMGTWRAFAKKLTAGH
jgi:hypothetical protein